MVAGASDIQVQYTLIRSILYLPLMLAFIYYTIIISFIYIFNNIIYIYKVYWSACGMNGYDVVMVRL